MRRYDLDWIRVLVFGLLILYHVGMFFVPWDWHIKNNETYEGLQWPMHFVNQWRLASLFLISGMGTRFALAKRSRGQYVRERVKRLLLPLIFGMLVIIPPQVYVERMAYGGYDGSYISFWFHDAFSGIYPEGNLSWHHLWFLPYLLIFSLVLTPLFILLRDHRESPFLVIQRRWLNRSPNNLYRYIIPLYIVEAFLEPLFPVTHALVGDWFAIVLYLIIFFYGFNFIALGDVFWRALNKIKFSALIIGMIAYGCYVYLCLQEDSITTHFIAALAKTINFWSWMLVIFGCGAVYLNKSSALLTYCNTAVYPFYIVHQTITVILAYFLYQTELDFWVKFGILTVWTFLLSSLIYEVVRRIQFLRLVFGLK